MCYGKIRHREFKRRQRKENFMDIQEVKNQLIESLAMLDMELTEEEIQKASKEELLRYIELTEKIKARLDVL